MDAVSRNPNTGSGSSEEKDETIQAIVDSGNRHYNEALALAHAGRLDEALAQVQAAISIVGNQPAYYNLLGTVQAQKGLYSEAIDAWQRCLSLDPEMEKAARSIERARLMEEEAAEEARRRPYWLWATGGLLAAAICLVAVIGLGMKYWLQRQSILSLNRQVATLDAEKTDLAGRLSVYATLPPDQWFEVQKKKDQAEAQAAELREEINRVNQQHATRLAAMQQEIGTIKADLQAKTQEYLKLTESYNEAVQLRGDVAALQAKLDDANGRVSNMQRLLSESKDELQKTLAQLSTVRAQVAEAQKAGDEAVLKERERKVQTIEDLQQKLTDADQQILMMRRRLENLRTANSKTSLALQALDKNDFVEAKNALDQALEFWPNESLATMLHKKVVAILEDPVEQARLRDVAARRDQERAAQVERYVAQYRLEGEGWLKKGHFDEAGVSFRRALELAGDRPVAKDLQSLLGQADEGKARITLLIDEAHKAMGEGDLANAQRVLKEVLKAQPDHAVAKQLLEQMAL